MAESDRNSRRSKSSAIQWESRKARTGHRMLRFTKRADYGLMAIHYIAVNDGFGAVSAKRIAQEVAIPPELMAKLLPRLAQQRLAGSTHGPKGGDARPG